jgi:uncharacterized protein (TIGR00369 family)
MFSSRRGNRNVCSRRYAAYRVSCTRMRCSGVRTSLPSSQVLTSRPWMRSSIASRSSLTSLERTQRSLAGWMESAHPVQVDRRADQALERPGIMAVTLEAARAALRSQPFSALLGAELTSFDSEATELRVPITDKLKQQHGFVHGGVISYAADNALTFAAGLALGPSIVTSEFKINYLRPASGEALVARASILHAGKSQAVCRCEVFAVAGAERVLCAVALGTVASLARPG